ncbi:MAG: hypothetical protein OEL83_04350 [Desulforhopalus sp.]|nr:hypothetical protein [Desulforhopalus sp.]
MKFYCNLIIISISLIFLSSCGDSKCANLQVDYNKCFSATLETIKKASQDSSYRTGNFSKDMDSYLDKLSSLSSKLCNPSELKKAKEEIECLKGLKTALISSDERLINEYSTCLSNMNPWHSKVVERLR